MELKKKKEEKEEEKKEKKRMEDRLGGELLVKWDDGLDGRVNGMNEG
jgi:hypothetical protein